MLMVMGSPAAEPEPASEPLAAGAGVPQAARLSVMTQARARAKNFFIAFYLFLLFLCGVFSSRSGRGDPPCLHHSGEGGRDANVIFPPLGRGPGGGKRVKSLLNIVFRLTGNLSKEKGGKSTGDFPPFFIFFRKTKDGDGWLIL